MVQTLLFHDMFEHHAAARGDALCIDDGVRALTFAEARTEVRRIANGLAELGLQPGDRFGYLSKNCADMWLMYLAAARSGVIPVPLNFRLAANEWRFILDNAKAKAVFVGEGYAEAIATILPNLQTVETVIAMETMEGARNYREWLSAQSDDTRISPVAADSIFYQMYTSGTTGLPKGVLVNHSNYAANLSQCTNAIARLPDAGSRALVVTPLYHAAAVWICAFATARGMAILLKRDFDPDDVVDTLSREDVAFTFLVPAMIQACLTTSNLAERDFSSLKLLMYGASPIAESVLRDAMATFDCDFYQAYGLTETTAILTLLDAAAHRRALAGEPHLLLAAGRALPGTDLRIGKKGDNGIGEILARGPQIVPGYWELPDADAAFFSQGWAHTGDAGEIDPEGYLYIRDRIKDMVVSGGENIYPREVENALFEHPAIVDATVIGVPDEKYGEALLALVVAKAGDAALDADAVIAHCRGLLGGYKVPRRIEFIDEIPRNSSGKVLKHVLREPYWADAMRQVG